MAELNKVEFKYAQNGIELSDYRSIGNTNIGHYIIDASNLTLITHKRKFDFMRLSDLYTTDNTYVLNNYALSLKGAKALYQYITTSRIEDSSNLLKAIADTSKYFNDRLTYLISGNAQTAFDNVIDTFQEIESFLSNISDHSTLTELLNNLESALSSRINTTNTNVGNLQQDLNDLIISNQSVLNTINNNIFNISTNINTSINKSIDDINTDLSDLIDRVTNIELGGGSGGGGSIDVDVLKNYVQFKDMTDTNLMTSYVDPYTTEKYNLNEILSAFAEPLLPDMTVAEILYDNPVTISTMENNQVIGTLFNKPTVQISGAIKLNAQLSVSPVIEQGTITGTITYRKLKANRVETEERTYVDSKDFTLITNGGQAYFSTSLTFNNMPTLYFGESLDDNSIVSLSISIRQLRATYPAKILNITNGIITGNNDQTIRFSLPSPQTATIPETVITLGKNAAQNIINFTSFSPAYYILRMEKIVSFTQRTGTIFNPAEELEIIQEGEYYYYVVIPNNFNATNLKAYYRGTDNGTISTYRLIPTTFVLTPTYAPNIQRQITLYVVVNEQNKPVKLQTGNGGSVKIIL